MRRPGWTLARPGGTGVRSGEASAGRRNPFSATNDQRMKTIRFYLAGVQFVPASAITSALDEGLRDGVSVDLVPEPTNKYDPNAVAVCFRRIRIGYVPKAQQEAIRGAATGKLAPFDLNDPPWERFAIVVEPALRGLDEEEDPKVPKHSFDRGVPPPSAEIPRRGDRASNYGPEPKAPDAPLEIVAPAYAIDGITAAEAARKRRDELLEDAGKIEGIETADKAQYAAALLQDITTFTRTIEETREIVKRPILEAGRKIDATAKTLTADLSEDAKRLGNLLGAYQAAQKKIEEENKRRAYEEQIRLAREAEDRERKIREEAEAARRKLNAERTQQALLVDPKLSPEAFYGDLTEEQFAETLKSIKAARKAREKAEAAAAKAKTEKEKADAERRQREAQEAEERRQREEAERAETARKDREAREQQAELDRANADSLRSAQAAQVAVAPPNKIRGIAVGHEIKFEVTDVVALYEAAPYLVKLEPNVSSIKAALKQLAEGQSLPGVRHWKEAKTVVRQ